MCVSASGVSPASCCPLAACPCPVDCRPRPRHVASLPLPHLPHVLPAAAGRLPGPARPARQQGVQDAPLRLGPLHPALRGVERLRRAAQHLLLVPRGPPLPARHDPDGPHLALRHPGVPLPGRRGGRRHLPRSARHQAAHTLGRGGGHAVLVAGRTGTCT